MLGGKRPTGGRWRFRALNHDHLDSLASRGGPLPVENVKAAREDLSMEDGQAGTGTSGAGRTLAVARSLALPMSLVYPWSILAHILDCECQEGFGPNDNS